MQTCPNQIDSYCFEEVDIVSMAIHLLDDNYTTVDVYYVERNDMVGGAIAVELLNLKVFQNDVIVPKCMNLQFSPINY